MDYIIGQKTPPHKAAPQRPTAPSALPSRHAQAGHPDDAALIVEGDQKTFMADVIETSRTMPVLVDFWAPWCGPCKTLTPALERVVRAAGAPFIACGSEEATDATRWACGVSQERCGGICAVVEVEIEDHVFLHLRAGRTSQAGTHHPSRDRHRQAKARR